MVCPIIISLSVTPGASFFCAIADPVAIAMLPKMMAALIHERCNVIGSSMGNGLR
jgi:hypothetical protein